MTLHWWMHWFWITQLLPVLALLFVTGQCARIHPESTLEPYIAEEPWALPSSDRLEDKNILKRDVGNGSQLNLTTSHDSNSSSRTSKSLESVTNRVKINKSDIELNDTLNSTIVSLNVSDSESVNVTKASDDVDDDDDDDDKPTALASTVDPLSNSSVEKLGRAASRSLDEEDTTPISKSHVAGPLSNSHRTGLDAAAITGIALGIVVFAGVTGAVSFVVYRRRYLNKPQTLNDKCSNPDSSGYIDDSTLRENSEEMYSLDNDSFLNSLEAMTIQNYWTDNRTRRTLRSLMG
ncbi:uncharacterized protein [Anabrus simplex]|uniref:uncharacterized protein isoform X2 n=1 Tax=Anabrus simplex TaxID=316456 RepID=UPI0035A3B8F5